MLVDGHALEVIFDDGPQIFYFIKHVNSNASVETSRFQNPSILTPKVTVGHLILSTLIGHPHAQLGEVRQLGLRNLGVELVRSETALGSVEAV